MRVGRSGIQICSAVPDSINNSILWDRKCPKKIWLKWLWRLEILFPISAREYNVGERKRKRRSIRLSECMTAPGGKELWKTSLRECLPIWETPPGVASRWSQVGVFANLSGPARNPRTPLYYANTAKLLNKYNHPIDANTGGFAK